MAVNPAIYSICSTIMFPNVGATGLAVGGTGVNIHFGPWRRAPTIDDIAYVVEQLADSTERQLLAALRADPGDKAARDALHDHLMDAGRPVAAELVKNGWTPW